MSIIRTVQQFKNKVSTDFTDINMNMDKTIITEIVKPLTHICNVSFQTGVFPKQISIATKVIPVFKAGVKCVFTNYRLISLLPQLSKNLEKLYNARLEFFLIGTIYIAQYGFRSNMSTSHAILELVEITNYLDNDKYSIGVFIYLKKAFDIVDHEVLAKNKISMAFVDCELFRK